MTTNLYTRLCAFDLAVLDGVFTRVAHMAHDLFAWRAILLSRASLVLCPISSVLWPPTVFTRIDNCVFCVLCLFIEFFVFPPPPKVGCANIRRYLDQNVRLAFVWFLSLSVICLDRHGVVVNVGTVCWLYFGGVQERPRERRRAPAPAFGGAL